MPRKKKKRSGFPESEAPKSKPPQRDAAQPPRRWGLIVMFLVISIGGTYLAVYLRPKTQPDRFTFKVLNKFKHDPKSFTQGLVMHKGFLWESTGLRGESTIRKTNLETGEVIDKRDLDPKLFGEGLAVLGDKFYQLTWQAERGFVYTHTENGFQVEREFEYEGEGWGLATDGKSLILSNGSRELKFIDPETFEVQRSIWVRQPSGSHVGQLNELEYFQGKIYANRYQTDLIYEIDPESGRVTKVIDLKGLWTQRPVKGVLNGIAVSPNNRLLVTGKLCPYVYELSFELVEN